jgi:hypothetical protein
LATDALLSDYAESFLTRLTRENLRVWWNDAYPHFMADPLRNAVDRPTAGEPDAKIRIVEPFLLVFRMADADTVEIANITWSPNSPGGDPTLARHL